MVCHLLKELSGNTNTKIAVCYCASSATPRSNFCANDFAFSPTKSFKYVYNRVKRQQDVAFNSSSTLTIPQLVFSGVYEIPTKMKTLATSFFDVEKMLKRC